jgi:hypothetical protein
MFLFIIILIIVVFIFEVWMFINAIFNDSISKTRKILWIIGMLFIHPFAALGYYFIDYKKK